MMRTGRQTILFAALLTLAACGQKSGETDAPPAAAAAADEDLSKLSGDQLGERVVTFFDEIAKAAAAAGGDCEKMAAALEALATKLDPKSFRDKVDARMKALSEKERQAFLAKYQERAMPKLDQVVKAANACQGDARLQAALTALVPMGRKDGDKGGKHDCAASAEAARRDIAGGDFEGGIYRCGLHEETMERCPDYRQACQELYRAAIDPLAKKLAAMRDRGEVSFKVSEVCKHLETAAKAVGGDAVARAERACTEARAASHVADAVAKAEKNIAAGRDFVPASCEAGLEALARLDTDWARDREKTLVEACYVLLGKRYLEGATTVGDRCPPRARQIFAAVDKYGVDDPDIARHRKRLAVVCDDAKGR